MNQQLQDLRKVMAAEGVDYYIVTGTDPHNSEYPPRRWQSREWLTGFTGSAGTVVVSADHAGLWTDSRYFLQAEKELAGTGFSLYKIGLPGVPDYLEWIKNTVKQGQVVAGNKEVITIDLEKKIKEKVKEKGAEYTSGKDLLDLIWPDRPGIPDAPVYSLDLSFCGKSRKEKLDEIRTVMKGLDADYYLVSSLPDTAWITNLRGNDVEYNPLFLSYLLIGTEESFLFIPEGKIDSGLSNQLLEDGIKLKPYGSESVVNFLAEFEGDSVLMAPEASSAGIYHEVKKHLKVVLQSEISSEMKTVKNKTELNGIRKAMVKDGTALVRFFFYLENNWEKLSLTEVTAAVKLAEFRGEQDGFMGESFCTIAGFEDHGAIVHYSAEPETAYTLNRPGVLLLDSGGHYLEGTTDITRVIALGGRAGENIKKDYTNVLKGHIDLASAFFPVGTCGIQLDTIARYPLWQNGDNYLHGTGHGVGHFLPVHEGPASIKAIQPSKPLKEGMVLSDEPGIYREGEYGIRIENLVTVKKADEFSGDFLKFETLTLCPYERDLIEPTLLTDDQINWINSYHRRVYRELSPYLNKEEEQWLFKKTTELERPKRG